MNIAVADELLRGIAITPAEALLDFAIGLYTERKASLGRAAAVAGVPQAEFLREMGRRKVPLHYDVADFEADCRVVAELRRA